MRRSSIPLTCVVVLGGCRIDPPSAGAYRASTGGESSGGSTAGSSDGSGDGFGSDSGGSSSDGGSTITLGVDATGTTGTTGVAETTGTSGDESSSGVVVSCGDGQLDSGEVCDDGVNDGGYGGCMPDCGSLGPHCGDGATNGPEVCDDGVNDGSYDGCMPDCLVLAEHCGDAAVNGPEVCDDGVNDGSYDGCATGCGMPGPYCGDVIVNGSEACDDGVNDGAYDGCAPNCLALAPHCGDGALNGPEVCDDGVNDSGYGGCAVGCLALAEHCGDGAVSGPEVCDDGVNDGVYGNCGIDCLSPATYCGDGLVNGPEACDDGNTDIHDGCFASCEVPTSCVDIKAYDGGALDGMYTIDADGGGGVDPFDVYCNMTADGGGWQLVSVRYQDIGALFADTVCTGIGTDCSGTIPDVQIMPGLAPDLLFATTDNIYWLRLTGLNPPGSYTLLDVITLDRALLDTNSCVGDHYCNVNLDTGLMVAGSSPNYTPRYPTLPAQFVRYGGIWLGNGGGGSANHVVSLNYFPYCGAPSGFQLSDDSDLSLGNVTCQQPGGLYFRY